MKVTAPDIMKAGSAVMDEVEAFLTKQLKGCYSLADIPFNEQTYCAAISQACLAGTKAIQEGDGKRFHASLVSLAAAAAMGAAHQRAASDAFTAEQAAKQAANVAP